MPKEKKPSDTKTPKKATARKSTSKKAAPSQPVSEEEAAAKAAVPLTSSSSEHVQNSQPSAAELYDEIRRRAYEFYCERGGEHGSHEADWHRAEHEVRSKYKA